MNETNMQNDGKMSSNTILKTCLYVLNKSRCKEKVYSFSFRFFLSKIYVKPQEFNKS